MWRRNESAVIVKVQLVVATLPGRSADLAAEHVVLGLGRRERGEVVLAREGGRTAASASSSSGRGHQSARLARSGARSRRSRTT